MTGNFENAVVVVLHGLLQGRQYYLNVCRGPAGKNWNLTTARKSQIALSLTQLGVPQGQGYKNLLDNESSPTEQTDSQDSSAHIFSLTLGSIQYIIFSVFQKLHPNAFNRIVSHRNYTCLHSISILKYD